jgi:hypothetical protein
MRIYDHAVAHHAQLIFMQDARRDKVKFSFPSTTTVPRYAAL